MLSPLPSRIQPTFKGSTNLTQEQYMELQKLKLQTELKQTQLQATARIVAGYAANNNISSILDAIPKVSEAIDKVEFSK